MSEQNEVTETTTTAVAPVVASTETKPVKVKKTSPKKATVKTVVKKAPVAKKTVKTASAKKTVSKKSAKSATKARKGAKRGAKRGPRGPHTTSVSAAIRSILDKSPKLTNPEVQAALAKRKQKAFDSQISAIRRIHLNLSYGKVGRPSLKIVAQKAARLAKRGSSKKAATKTAA